MPLQRLPLVALQRQVAVGQLATEGAGGPFLNCPFTSFTLSHICVHIHTCVHTQTSRYPPGPRAFTIASLTLSSLGACFGGHEGHKSKRRGVLLLTPLHRTPQDGGTAGKELGAYGVAQSSIELVCPFEGTPPPAGQQKNTTTVGNLLGRQATTLTPAEAWACLSCRRSSSMVSAWRATWSCAATSSSCSVCFSFTRGSQRLAPPPRKSPLQLDARPMAMVATFQTQGGDLELNKKNSLSQNLALEEIGGLGQNDRNTFVVFKKK